MGKGRLGGVARGRWWWDVGKWQLEVMGGRAVSCCRGLTGEECDAGPQLSRDCEEDEDE